MSKDKLTMSATEVGVHVVITHDDTAISFDVAFGDMPQLENNWKNVKKHAEAMCRDGSKMYVPCRVCGCNPLYESHK